MIFYLTFVAVVDKHQRNQYPKLFAISEASILPHYCVCPLPCGPRGVAHSGHRHYSLQNKQQTEEER